jgi:ABC-type uncharacterized transport system ATPase subunit
VNPLPAIETHGLTRRFGRITAVDDLNLQVPAGSLFGLIGPNGAGKTTTLRMLAGLLQPTSGEITINGQIANHDWRDLQRQIGYMPDFFGVYEDMLVWEYLDFFARCYDVPSARRRQVTDELLELVDLAEKRDTYVQTLSRVRADSVTRHAAAALSGPRAGTRSAGVVTGRTGLWPGPTRPHRDARATARTGRDGQNHRR